MSVNEQFSYQDFTDIVLLDVDPKELNDSEIIGSCFCQQCVLADAPPIRVFPDGMTGVTFRRCNLDNVLVPDGNTVLTKQANGLQGCSQQIIMPTNDGESWLWERDKADHDKLKPTKPMNYDERVRDEKSVSPDDIPSKREIEEIIPKDIWDAIYARDELPLHTFFKAKPTVLEVLENGDRRVKGEAHLSKPWPEVRLKSGSAEDIKAATDEATANRRYVARSRMQDIKDKLKAEKERK